MTIARCRSGTTRRQEPHQMKRLMLAILLISCPAGILVLHGQLPGDSARTGLVNLREHGAAGNGSTDDTAAIVSAFSGVCASGGGAIYIPPGIYIINPAVHTIPICSHLIVYGPGTLRVKAETGNYCCIFATDPRTGADDLTFTGINVDQNTSNNTTATIAVDDPGTHQLVWKIFAGTNLHFENMHLYVSGVDPIDVNGPTVSGVYIERNYIVFQKRAGQPEFDNSSIYIDGDNFHVTENTFESTAADAARTAIEIHTGSGSVTGNTIDHFSTGINRVNLKSSSVTGNNIRNAGYGISLWSTTLMDSVVISANTVSIAQVTRGTQSSWGIATTHSAGMNGEFSNLQISGNIVRFERESSPRAISGWANYGIG